MNWMDKLLGRDDRYSPEELERYRNAPNDRECTIEEYAEALDIERREENKRMAIVILNRLEQELVECVNCGHSKSMHIDRYGCQAELGDTLDGSRALPPCGCKNYQPDVPAPAEDEQATNEGGGKDVSARPTLTGCDWLRGEGVLDELPN